MAAYCLTPRIDSLDLTTLVISRKSLITDFFHSFTSPSLEEFKKHAVGHLHFQSWSSFGNLFSGGQSLLFNRDRTSLTHLAGRQYGTDLQNAGFREFDRSGIGG